MPSRLLGGVCVRVRTCAPWRRRDSVIWEQSSYLAKEEKGQNLSAPHEGICHVRQEDAGSPGAGCFPDFLLLGSGLCVQRALVLPSLPLLRLHLCPPPSRRPLPNSLLVTTATEHLPSPPQSWLWVQLPPPPPAFLPPPLPCAPVDQEDPTLTEPQAGDPEARLAQVPGKQTWREFSAARAEPIVSTAQPPELPTHLF